jgi:hypothetical protein
MNKSIMPLKIFWTDGYPIEEDVKEALEIAYKEGCKVRIEYVMFGYPYQVTMDYTETVEEVMARIPTVYGM